MPCVALILNGLKNNNDQDRSQDLLNMPFLLFSQELAWVYCLLLTAVPISSSC